MKTVMLLILLALPMATAITIDTIYYDALDESGSEFVILRNDEQARDLTGWRIATPASNQDATLAGTLAPEGTYLVADTGWEESRDDATWPPADHEETLTLANTNGYVQLISPDGTIHSTVGYGETNTSEGTPHPGAPEGEALVRTQNTGDNAADFTAQTPTFNSAGGNETIIDVTIENAPTRILRVTIEDDDYLTSGIQLLPLPGGERRVNVSVEVEDNNTLANTTVTANQELLIGPIKTTTGTYAGTVSITTRTRNITITANDGENTTTHTTPIELLKVVGLRVPDSITLAAAPGTNHTETITVENTGTTNLSLHVKGVQPSLGALLLGEVFYTFQGTEYPLLEEFREHAVNLAPGDEQRLTLRVQAGYVPSGTYSGQILIAGVEA